MKDLDLIIKNKVLNKMQLIKELEAINSMEGLKDYIDKLHPTLNEKILSSIPTILYGNELVIYKEDDI